MTHGIRQASSRLLIATMRHAGWGATVAVLALALSWLCAFVPHVEAAALSVLIPAREQSCFYSWVDQQYEKVGFYFAVQEGGDFDIDYSVVSPTDRVLMEGTKSSQEDFVFTANEFGEFRFCFQNNKSSHYEKLVRGQTYLRWISTSQ